MDTLMMSRPTLKNYLIWTAILLFALVFIIAVVMASGTVNPGKPVDPTWVPATWIQPDSTTTSEPDLLNTPPAGAPGNP